MPDSDPGNVTELLVQCSRGDKVALDRLVPLVYGELRRLASAYLRRERPDHTLQSTALVHEAYLRLVNQRSVVWQNRAHFFGMAAQMMRRILVDHARSQQASKRGAGAVKLELDERIATTGQRDLDLIALDDSLNRLGQMDPAQARVVELRFFGGLSIEETAEVMGISTATVNREWSTAKAWLYREMTRAAAADL